MAKYVYDAWGNHRIYAKIDSAYIDITDNINYNDHIGKVNPYRYRGYYYDLENGLYYLQNRYYDPVTRRFISSDSPAAAIGVQSGAFGGLNPYSYCLNDPVNHSDPTGRSVTLGWAIFWLIVSLIGLGVAVYGLSQSVAAFNKEPSWGNLLSVALSVVGVIASVISVVASVKAVVSAAKAVSLLRASQNVRPVAKLSKNSNSNNSYVNLASEGRTKHILYGDKTGGGHLFPGQPGKSTFPQDWTAEFTMHQISDVATDPSLSWVANRMIRGVQRYEVIGVRDNVIVKVITDGIDIITAFPIG